MSKTNGLITKDILSKPPSRRFEVREIEGFGKVRARSLTALEKHKHDNSAYEMTSTGKVKVNRPLHENADARLVVLVIVDEDGNQIFGNKDVPRLMEMDTAIFTQLVEFCEEMQEAPVKN